MTPNPISVTFDIGEGRMVTIETGKLARQSDGAVTVRLGDCVILATVVATKEPKEGQSFFPLTVDYQEKFASAGRIPGSFFKREARLNDYINPAAFSMAPQFTFGNIGRTIDMRGPGQVNWDISLFKDIVIKEKLKAQFRCEALNAMNTPLFYGPNVSYGSSSFGKITTQANFSRQLQLALRFSF